jgi:glycosyltransferase involved in cell wall biosynthesis
VPQALVQAMLCGLPCVTTPIGGIGEVARDEVTALVVPPRDRDALAAAISRFAGDPAFRSELGTASAKALRRELLLRAHARSDGGDLS